MIARGVTDTPTIVIMPRQARSTPGWMIWWLSGALMTVAVLLLMDATFWAQPPVPSGSSFSPGAMQTVVSGFAQPPTVIIAPMTVVVTTTATRWPTATPTHPATAEPTRTPHPATRAKVTLGRWTDEGEGVEG